MVERYVLNDVTCMNNTLELSSSGTALCLKLARTNLVNLIFSAKYTERRWINDAGRFRDVMEVDEVDCDATKSLKDVVRMLSRKKYRVNNKSVLDGVIHKSSEGNIVIYYDWDGESSSPPFGHYWFIINSIDDSQALGKYKKLLLSLKILRPVALLDESIPSKNLCRKCGQIENTNNLLSYENLFSNCQVILSVPNFKRILRICIVLLIAGIGGLSHLIFYLCELFICLLRESSWLIQCSMPFLLALVELMGKIFGAIFLIITMMWRTAMTNFRSQSPRVMASMPGTKMPPPNDKDSCNSFPKLKFN